MQLYCAKGVVLASHDDDQAVPASAYGEGVTVVPYAGDLSGLARVGEAPPDGQPDRRPFAQPPVDLGAHAAAARWARETGGIAVGGLRVATDAASQAKITAAYVKASRDAGFTTQWKGADGRWTALDAPAVLALGDAVLAHVAACYAAERKVADGIAAGTVKTTDDVDAAFAAVAA